MSENNLNQSGNGGMDNDPSSKAFSLPTDGTHMGVTSQVSVGPIKQVGNGKLGDVAGQYVDQAADNGGSRKPMGQFDAPPDITSKLAGSGSGESQR